MKKFNLTKKMILALILGLMGGIFFIYLKDYLIGNGKENIWLNINNLFFADISTKGNEQAIGIFYIIGQLFVRSLQMIIIPMVFTSIILAIIKINDTKKLGIISTKTILIFLLTSMIALITASLIGFFIKELGFFHQVQINNIEIAETKTGTNPLMILINAIPLNVTEAFSQNSGVLAIVILAIIMGIAINNLQEKIKIIPQLCHEINEIIINVLTYIVNKFGPIAIFSLILRTFSIYGTDSLKSSMLYIIVVTIMLLLYLIFGYALYIKILAKLNPIPFIRKILKVSLFGFSTSSSAATLPLNLKTTTQELGVDEEIASFVLPLGTTINMDGTAIMQVIATIFIATTAGYDLNFSSLILIGFLALIASIGTPAAPGAGAIVLFTILSGTGFVNETAMMMYTIILAINRPIEMLVTSLNCVGDTASAMIVAKSENLLDEDVYYEEF